MKLFFQNKTLIPCLFALALVFNACKDDGGNGTVIPTDCTGAHWTYEGAEGPEHWDELCTGYSDCAGPSQSPVDIKNAQADAALADIPESYQTSTAHILNNGHTIQFNYDAGSSIVVNGETYNLAQFHFHTPSEHTINGQSYPMEVHLVHKNADGTKLAVIGVLFEEGAENPILAKYLAHLPASKDQTYDDAASTFTAADFLPADQHYYRYQGSLTTPPCSEIVTWTVMKTPITASHEQIQAIEAIEHENNRPIQALNGRTITAF